MSNMPTYQITSTANIPIGDGTNMYFGEYNEGSPFVLKKFVSNEEALNFYSTLKKKWNPNMANVYPPFQVKEGHYLAFEKLGVSLTTFLESSDNGKMFCAFNTISKFYQTILKDLLLVVHHLMDTPIKSVLNLDDVCIFVDGKAPHITLTNFKLRDSGTDKDDKDDWKELGKLIDTINKGSKYGEVVTEEMKSLLYALENSNRASLQGIARNSLFMDLVERRHLMCSLYEYIHVTSFKIYNEQTKEAFGTDPRLWKSLIEGDEKLKLIKTHFDLKIKSKVSGLKFEREDNSLEKAIVDCIKFIRKCYIRPSSLNREIVGLDLNSVEAIQGRINAVFPNHIWILSQYLLYQEKFDVRCIVSPQEIKSLTELFKEFN